MVTYSPQTWEVHTAPENCNRATLNELSSMLWGLYGFQSFFSFESVIALRNSWIKNKVCDRTTGQHMYKTWFLRQQLSGLRHTYLRPLNRHETRTVTKTRQPPSPLLSSMCTLCKQLFSFLFCFCYVARSMSSKDTCFVVSCKNKTISLLCMLFSISGMERSLSRGLASTQIV